MIPKKIEKKLKEKCGKDVSAFNNIMELLDKLDKNGKRNATQNALNTVEKYYKEVESNEN